MLTRKRNRRPRLGEPTRIGSQRLKPTDFNEAGVPYQMTIVKSDGFHQLNQPNSRISADSQPRLGQRVEHSLILSIIELIEATEQICEPIELIPRLYPGHDVSDRPGDMHKHIHETLWHGIKFFSESDKMDHPCNDFSPDIKFRQLLIEGRNWDSDYSTFLCSYEDKEITNPSATMLKGDSDEALNYYVNLKLHEQVNLTTTLDIFVIVNAYHAILTIYDASLSDPNQNHWYHSCHNEYNLDSEDSPRPRWIIIYDLESESYFPVLDEIDEDMYYGYKPEHWGSLFIHSVPPKIYELK